MFLAYFTALDGKILFTWQLLWLALVAASFIITLGFFKRGLSKWSGNPLEVPNAGPFAIILCGMAWSVAAFPALIPG